MESSVELSNQSTCLFYVADCECADVVADLIIKKVNEHRASNGSCSDLIVLSDGLVDGSLSVSEFFVHLFRRYRLHSNERTVVWSSVDQLITTQLVLAAKNKQFVGEFDVESRHVIEVHTKMMNNKLSSTSAEKLAILETLPSLDDLDFNSVCSDYNCFLSENNAVDVADVFMSVKSECESLQPLKDYINTCCFLVINPQVGNTVELEMLEFLSSGKLPHCVSVCLPLDESFGPHLALSRVDVTIDRCSRDALFEPHVNTDLKSPSQTSSSLSTTEVYVEQVVLGYIRLLVNSRDELALARVLNVPGRGLDHFAFTDVKHQAKRCGLSMYQTISSFVMKIRLGGKGYAPGVNCSLLKYSKGLSEFTDLMLKLQTVIEEELNIEASLRRIFTIVKNCVAKSTDPPLRRSSVDIIATRLCDEALSTLNKSHKLVYVSPCRPVSAGGSNAGRQTVKILRTVIDHHSLLSSTCDSVGFLSDAVTSQRTPIRLTSLLSAFRSPAEEEIELQKELEAKQQKPKPLTTRFCCCLSELQHQPNTAHQSCLDWAPADSNKFIPRNITDYILSKTLVCPARRIIDPINTGKENIPSQTVDCADSTSLHKDFCNMEVTPLLPAVSTSSKRPLQLSSTGLPAKKLKQTAPKQTLKPKVKPLPKGQKQLSAFFRL